MGAERLPMRQIREVLRLRHEKGLSQRAIARACGLGTGRCRSTWGVPRVRA